MVEGGLGGAAGQAGEGFAGAGYPAGANAGAGADPLVIGVNPLAELLIGDAGCWHCAATSN